MKVVLRIGRIVLHGAAEFDRHTFEQTLQDEIRRRLPQGVAGPDVARSFDVTGSRSGVAGARPIAGSPALVAASTVAQRLVP